MLGVLAVAALAGFLAVLATRKSEVELLVEVLKGDNRADAAWAFERLKEVSDGELRELGARVDDPAPTLLHDLHWEGQGSTSSTSFRDQPFSVGYTMRFVLGGRLRLDHPWRFADSATGQGPTREAWAEEIARFERTHLDASCHPLDAYPAPRRLSLVPTIVPPSRLPELAARRDAARLLEVLGTGGKAEAAWAFEVLRDLPDEDLDPLIPQADSEAPTKVYHLSWRSGSNTSRSEAFRTGEVVQFLIADRIGGLLNPQALPSVRLRGKDLEQLLAAWRKHRAASAGQ